MHILTVLLCLFQVVTSFDVTPLVVSSHRLVRNLKHELDGDNLIDRQSGQAVTNMLKRLVTECTSDEYVILNMPGLKYSDLTDDQQGNWPFLVKYLSLASTSIGLPFINDIIDLDYIRDYIRTTCSAELINAEIGDEGSVSYIDSKTRVITLDFDALSEDGGERAHQIRQNDEFMRKIIRKLPSPHYTIILTSSTKSHIDPRPRSVFVNNPLKFGLFHSIVSHPVRQEEVELHDMYKKVEPNWIDSKHTNDRYLRNKENDKVKLLDYELWVKNEKLIMTILIMILTVALIRLKQLFSAFIVPSNDKIKLS